MKFTENVLNNKLAAGCVQSYTLTMGCVLGNIIGLGECIFWRTKIFCPKTQEHYALIFFNWQSK